jgi:hypothetical protein
MLLVLAPAAYFAWNARDMPQLDGFHDDGIYWVCAKSLAQGSGYRILSLPDQPYQTKYPPLYPLLLSVIWRVNPSFPDNLPLATLVSWLMLPLYLVLARRVFLDLGLGPAHALVLCVLLALNPYVVLYSVSLMSELMFSCLLLGCLWLARRAGEPGSPGWVAALAGAVAAAAYLTRNAALPLLVSGPLYYLLRKQYARAALFFGAMLPAVAGWNLWVRAHLPASRDFVTLYYTDYLGFHLANFTWRDLPLLLSKNLSGVLEGIGGLFLVFGGKLLLQIVGVVAILGTLRMVRRSGVSQYHLFAAGHVLLLLPWHLGLYDQYLRLVLPILPLLLAGLSSEFRRGAVQVHAWLKSAAWRRVLLACVLSGGLGFIGVVGTLSMFVTLYQFPGFSNRNRVLLANNRAAYRWIAENLPRDSTFLAAADPLLYLYTGRPACHFVVPPRLIYLDDQAKISELYRKVAEYGRARRLSYVFLNVGEEPGSGLGLFAGQGVVAPSPDFHLLHQTQTTRIYRIN